jgi:hypothetical protein
MRQSFSATSINHHYFRHGSETVAQNVRIMHPKKLVCGPKVVFTRPETHAVARNRLEQ